MTTQERRMVQALQRLNQAAIQAAREFEGEDERTTQACWLVSEGARVRLSRLLARVEPLRPTSP